MLRAHRPDGARQRRHSGRRRRVHPPRRLPAQGATTARLGRAAAQQRHAGPATASSPPRWRRWTRSGTAPPRCCLTRRWWAWSTPACTRACSPPPWPRTWSSGPSCCATWSSPVAPPSSPVRLAPISPPSLQDSASPRHRCCDAVLFLLSSPSLSTLCPGFADRLLREVYSSRGQQLPVRVYAPKQRQFTTWTGGCVCRVAKGRSAVAHPVHTLLPQLYFGISCIVQEHVGAARRLLGQWGRHLQEKPVGSGCQVRGNVYCASQQSGGNAALLPPLSGRIIHNTASRAFSPCPSLRSHWHTGQAVGVQLGRGARWRTRVNRL